VAEKTGQQITGVIVVLKVSVNGLELAGHSMTEGIHSHCYTCNVILEGSGTASIQL
jgi:hypothetical protein